MSICEKLSKAPGHPAGDGAARAADMLPVLNRLQFVQRCHLAMHRPDLAGALIALQPAPPLKAPMCVH